MRNLGTLILALVALATAGKKDLAKIDINSAPADSLAAHLPGVGPAIAQRIVEGRPYATCGDISGSVPGIGAKKIAKLCPYLEF
jgi:competence protein ComEA